MTRAELLSLPKHRFVNWHRFKLLAGIECGLITVEEVMSVYEVTRDEIEDWRRLCLNALKLSAMYGKRAVA